MSVLTDRKNAFCGAIIGRRKSGKTTLMVDLLRSVWRHRFDFIVMISQTIARQSAVWQSLSGQGIMIVPKISQRLLHALRAYQSSEEARGEILIVLDDVGMRARQDATGIHDDFITDIALDGRWFKISVLFLAQRITQITPTYRSQIDFFFFFGSVNRREINLVHAEYSEQDINDFRKFLNDNLMDTDDHSVLLFMNKSGKKITTMRI